MRERRRSKKRKRTALLGSHQKSWLWGRHVVVETLRVGSWPIQSLHLADRLPESERAAVRNLAEAHGVQVLIEPWERLTQLAHTGEHQGCLAKMGPFPYTPAERLLASLDTFSLVVVLDRIQDPTNFGAIVRSAVAFGVAGIVIGARQQVPVTSAVARASAGTINRIPVTRVEDLCDMLARLRKRGLQVVGTVCRDAGPPWDIDFRRGSVILIGNEAEGLDEALISQCDELTTIPMAVADLSFNAAMAAGIVLYEVHRQRTVSPTPSQPS